MKHLFPMLLVAALCSHLSTYGQIVNAAVQADEVVPHFGIMPPTNTGVAIAPGADITAVVADEGSGATYEIHFFDKTGANITSHNSTGFDPDVAYNQNSDLAAVVYCHAGTVWIDMYEMFINALTGNPFYRGMSATFVGPGSYPNVDINSLGDGAFCFESGGGIALRAFGPNTPSSTIYPPVPVGVGTQPDVIVSDNGDDVIVTFVRNGDLHIVKLEYQALTQGSLNVSLHDVHPGGGNNYVFPRIASARNGAFANPDHFTVVAQRNTPGGIRIEAFSYPNGATSSNYLVNTGFTTCLNAKPVVAYDLDRIVFAWSADYSGCSIPVESGNAVYNDVLLAEHSIFSLANLHGGFFEVNTLQGGFAQGNVSITAKYDGVHPVISHADGWEATTYSNNTQWFWKDRAYATSYKSSDSGKEEPTNANVKLLVNPVQDVAQLQGEHLSDSQVQLMDATGRNIELADRLDRKANQLTIDLSDLPTGLYLIDLQHQSNREVFKVIRE